MAETDDIQKHDTDDVAERLRLKVSLLPDLPGCYLYLDREGTVIYVGKAKRLRRRVSSYFNREHDSLKTRMLVRHIADLNYVVVGSEDDALHLENALIKEHNPKYNILLKDDKSYPWICVTNEYYPRVFMTRDVDKKLGRFYGPYANPGVARTVLRLAVYEILHREDVPVSVAINEAVELAKKYGGEEDASFINGVLGGIARDLPQQD